MKTNQILTLPDGRKLAYAEFGKPDGHPVLHFHASPSTRLEPLIIGEEVFRQYGLRVIATDRPDMRGSDFQPNREYSDFTMANPERMAVYKQVLNESVKQGVKGAAWDIRMNVREWDFNLDEIQIPILLFHGGLDKNMPLARVQQTARQLHDARLVTYPEDGHISSYANNFDEIAEALLPN